MFVVNRDVTLRLPRDVLTILTFRKWNKLLSATRLERPRYFRRFYLNGLFAIEPS
jgi:hypothetical protein